MARGTDAGINQPLFVTVSGPVLLDEVRSIADTNTLFGIYLWFSVIDFMALRVVEFQIFPRSCYLRILLIGRNSQLSSFEIVMANT